MPRNVEIKAVLRDRVGAEAWATARCRSGPELLEQEDVFFPCEGARLKLRILGPKRGELIRYRRNDAAEARTSEYVLARTNDPQALREILAATLGTAGVVRKTRLLYMVGQTRVHIDRVEGLGDFLELEVVMRPEQSEQEGKHIAEGLLSELGIRKTELLAEAYVDMLRARG
jgi:predicted adenylyl cyclase CyaB